MKKEKSPEGLWWAYFMGIFTGIDIVIILVFILRVIATIVLE